MRKTSLVATAAASLILPSLTSASDSLQNFYISGDILVAEADLGVDDFGGQDINVSVDDADAAGRLSGGFQVNEFFAIEGSISNSTEGGVTVTGDFDRIVNGQRLVFDGTASIDAEADPLIFLGAKFSYPIVERFKVDAIIGQVWWDVAFEGAAQVSGTYGGDSFSIGERVSLGSNDGSDVYYGFGASYAITDQISANAELFQAKIDDTDVDAYSAGLTYRF
jgi:opacity protein-like surface antigen